MRIPPCILSLVPAAMVLQMTFANPINSRFDIDVPSASREVQPTLKMNGTLSDDYGCQNGAPPYFLPNGKPLVLPAGVQRGKTVCNCPKAPGFKLDPTYGKSLTGVSCEHKCNFECMRTCISCLNGHETVYEGDTKFYDTRYGGGGWHCAPYCGGGASFFAYTDTCCYHVCGCDVTHQTSPNVVSQCLDATEEKSCLGNNFDDKCRISTISQPAMSDCTEGYHCHLKGSPDGTRVYGICEKDRQSLRRNIDAKIPQVKNVGCVYSGDFGQVLDNQGDQKACLTTTSHGDSQEKIVHSDAQKLHSYAVKHAPNVGFGNRTAVWQSVTCNITGNCPPHHVLEYHELLKVEGWWDSLFHDAVDFGEEVWGGVETACGVIGWGGCWSVVSGVIGLL